MCNNIEKSLIIWDKIILEERKTDANQNNFKNQNNFAKLVLTLLHSLCYNPTQWFYNNEN